MRTKNVHISRYLVSHYTLRLLLSLRVGLHRIMFPFELKSELYLDITLQYLHTYTNTLGSEALTWARGQD